MKIYTKSGDAGDTSLFAGGRVSKDDVRLHAYGTVDELNAILGLVLASDDIGTVRDVVRRVQAELFVAGSDLATPLSAEAKWVVRVTAAMTAQLETEIDGWQAELPELRNFVLPGGSLAGSFLHQARTVCRRAERWVVTLSTQEPDTPVINGEVLKYLNRLSDWLFVLARMVNHRAGQPEETWKSPTRTE